MSSEGGPRYGSNDEAEAPRCSRHPDRGTWTTCARCGRPACADCLVQAPVGMQCIDCVRETARTSRVGRTIFGGVAQPQARPMVTYVLIGICAVLWAGQWMSDEVTNRMLFAPFLGVEEPWRFLTACFVHLPRNPTHIAMNMLALWSVGQALEPMLGRARFVALYLLSGLAGSVAMLLSAVIAGYADRPDLWFTGSLGASGAVFGLFGAYFVAARRSGLDSTWLVSLLLLNAVITLVFPGIAWEAHVGGLVAGAGTMLVLAWSGTVTRIRLQWPLLVGVLGLLLVMALSSYAFAPLPFL